jgi:hypothetical protein
MGWLGNLLCVLMTASHLVGLTRGELVMLESGKTLEGGVFRAAEKEVAGDVGTASAWFVLTSVTILSTRSNICL